MNASNFASVRKYTRLHAHAVQDPAHLDEALTRQVIGHNWSSPLGRKADVLKLSQAGFVKITPLSPHQWLHAPEAAAVAHLDPRPPAVRTAILNHVSARPIAAQNWGEDHSGLGDSHSATAGWRSSVMQKILPRLSEWQPQHTLLVLCVVALLLLAFVVLH